LYGGRRGGGRVGGDDGLSGRDGGSSYNSGLSGGKSRCGEGLVSGEGQSENSVGQDGSDGSAGDVSGQVELSLDVVSSERSLVDVEVVLSLRGLRDDEELVSGKLDVDVVALMAGKVDLDDVVVSELVDIGVRSSLLEESSLLDASASVSVFEVIGDSVVISVVGTSSL